MSHLTPEDMARYEELRNEAVAAGLSWVRLLVERRDSGSDEEWFWTCMRHVLQLTFQNGVAALKPPGEAS